MSVVLIESTGSFRRWEYTMPGGDATYTIDYGGGSARTGSLALDGEVVAANRGSGLTERYAFVLGETPASLEVRHDSRMRIKSLRLVAGGATAYTEGESLADSLPPESQAPEIGLPLPPQIQVEQTSDAVEVHYREATVRGASSVVMGVLMLAAGAYFYFVMGPTSIWLTLAWEVFGLWAIYSGVARLVNRTTIRLDRQELSLRRGPLPTQIRKPGRLAADRVRGFTTNSNMRRSGFSRSVTYTLVALLPGGEQLVVLEDISQEIVVAMRNALAKFYAERMNSSL